MDQRCPDCQYDYGTLNCLDAPSVLRREARVLAETLTTAQQRPSIPDGTWTAVQYAGHVRDVLVVTRERTLNARHENGVEVVPMGRDERVAWGEYENLTLAGAAGEVVLVADWLAHTWERLSASEWTRTVLYNYPEPRTRRLSWVATHTVHEVVHHRGDIQGLTSDLRG